MSKYLFQVKDSHGDIATNRLPEISTDDFPAVNNRYSPNPRRLYHIANKTTTTRER